MTRQDYIRIARALRHTITWRDGMYSIGAAKAAVSIAQEFSDDDPQFDSAHFLAVVRGMEALESRLPRKKETK